MSSSSSEYDFCEDNELAKQVSKAKSSKRSKEYRFTKRYRVDQSETTASVFSIDASYNTINMPTSFKIDEDISQTQVNKNLYSKFKKPP
jgi:hypothetical protein